MNIMMLVLNLDVGGQERMLVELAVSLHRLGNKTIICCLDQEGELATTAQDFGVEVIALNKGSGFSRKPIGPLKEMVNQHAIDIIHSHNQPGLVYGAMLSLATHLPHIHTKHGAYIQGRKSRLLQTLGMLKTHKLVAVSQSLEQEVHKNVSFCSTKTSVIENGIDMSDYLELPVVKPVGGPVLVHVARVNEVKNQTYLLQLFAQFHRVKPDARLIIVGDGPLMSQIQQVAEQLEISEFVEFAGMQKDVKPYLARANWFCLTSHSEGTPISVIEAMAAGLPVTTTRVGGMPEIVIEGTTGMLIEPGDDDRFLECWTKLAEQPQMCEQLGQQARDFVSSRYGVDRMLEQYSTLYQALLA